MLLHFKLFMRSRSDKALRELFRSLCFDTIFLSLDILPSSGLHQRTELSLTTDTCNTFVFWDISQDRPLQNRDGTITESAQSTGNIYLSLKLLLSRDLSGCFCICFVSWD